MFHQFAVFVLVLRHFSIRPKLASLFVSANESVGDVVYHIGPRLPFALPPEV